jgi:hypothetical protein
MTWPQSLKNRVAFTEDQMSFNTRGRPVSAGRGQEFVGALAQGLRDVLRLLVVVDDHPHRPVREHQQQVGALVVPRDLQLGVAVVVVVEAGASTGARWSSASASWTATSGSKPTLSAPPEYVRENSTYSDSSGLAQISRVAS